ncbi:unnamed protein product [Nyctereutes procyonoides]|uniref:(raccoon dog) hypothetical protein n=1 Tax=Nyctereutes procyonoides TaxID=34880 RepID=A0A811Y8P1_NYCPR|nr:unnamed protein product [Nyctereutes procyonoides]
MKDLNVQTNIRRLQNILVPQMLLAPTPDAVGLCEKANAALRGRTELGFPESRAAEALRLNHGPGHRLASSGPGLARRGTGRGGSQGCRDSEPRDELMGIFKKMQRKRGFRPDARAVISLMEMGLDEKEVRDALRTRTLPEELDVDPNRPLFQAILDNPVVQWDMLETPLNSTRWMNDPGTSRSRYRSPGSSRA